MKHATMPCREQVHSIVRIFGNAINRREHFGNFTRLVKLVIEGCGAIDVPLKDGGVAKVSLRDPRLSNPSTYSKWGVREILLPNECRASRGTYASDVTVSLRIVYTYVSDNVKQTKIHTVDNVVIGSIPIPVGTDPCNTLAHPELLKGHNVESPFTYGHLIVGTSRTIDSKEEMIMCRFICFKNAKGELRTRSTMFGPISYVVVTYQDGVISVKQSNVFRGDIDLTTIMSALGFCTDREVLDILLRGVTSDVHREAIEFYTRRTFQARKYDTQADALKIIKSKSDHDVGDIMNMFMPTCNTAEQKAVTLGILCRKFILVEESFLEPDNRDALTNKGVVSPAMAYASLLQSCMRKIMGHFRTPLKSQIQDPNMVDRNMFAKAILTMLLLNSMRGPIATGILPGITTRTGFSEAANDMNIPAIATRRVGQGSSSAGLGGSTLQHRAKNDSDFVKCAEGVQDGPDISKKCSMSMTIDHAQYSHPEQAIQIASDYLDSVGDVAIIVNGACIGHTSRPNDLVCDLRTKKRLSHIHPHTGIVWDILMNIVFVDTDQGRFVRPLFVVEDGKLLLRPDMSFENEGEIIASGIVEWLSPSEIYNAYIAMYPHDVKQDHQYCELHPGTMNDVSMAVIPFPWMNQSPRNVYQNQMGRQAFGALQRFLSSTTKRQALMFAESPMIRNMTERWIGLDEPIQVGINARVLVLTRKGKGQEDPTQMNKGSIDRGMFASVGIFPEVIDTCSNHPKTGKEEVYGNPDADESSITGPDGMPRIGKFVHPGDVIVSKFSPYNTPAGLGMRDSSIRVPPPGLVSKARRVSRVINYTIGGSEGCTVMTTAPIITGVGDKFAARHGQKGVVSCIIDERDMPNSPNGAADIILNPHALPSRMTIGMLVEMLLSQKCIHTKQPEFVEPFENMSVERVCEMLEEIGLKSTGDEVIYDGETGKKMTIKAFEGVCYYQKLKHMVDGKVHSRSSGPRVVVTRQPSEGKMKNGGLRIGEMERDALISLSCTTSLMTKFMKHSDEFEVYVCDTCGSYAQKCGKGHACTTCNGTTTVSLVSVPYAFKLMTQELEAIGISSRIMTR